MTEPTIASVSQELDLKLANAQDVIRTLQNTIDQYKTDILKLNELMNAYADAEEWCDDYDETVNEWNQKLVIVKLKDRRKKFSVSVKVKLYYDTTVEVEAVNADKAKEYIDEAYEIDTVMGGMSFYDTSDAEWSASAAVPQR